MVIREQRTPILVEALYDYVKPENMQDGVAELLYRMADNYVRGLSDDAFRDYWMHYCAEDTDND